MSATLSEATGRPYGIQRVCQAWERSRSALYARQTREQQRHKGEEPARRGPTPTVSGRDAAGGDSGRSRPLAVPGRGPSEGPRAAADLGRDPGRADAGAAGDAGAQAALPAPRPPGHRAGACRDDRHAGAERDVGHRRRAGLHVGRTGGAGSSQRSSTGTRSVWDGTCARVGAGLRRSSRSPRGSGASMAPSTPTALEGWRCGWTTAASTCPTTFSTRSGIGACGPATALSRNRKRTAWRSGGIARSRSKRPTGASSRTSRRYGAAVPAFVERYNTTWRLEKLGYHTPIEAREAHELRRAA